MSIYKQAFPLPLEVRFIDGRTWELLKPFKYVSKKLGEFDVPAKFRFDFASIPKIFWSTVGAPTGKYGPAALIHDYLIYAETVSRRIADKVFLHSMKACGVNWFKRWIMYRAVSAMTTALIVKGWFKK